MSSTHETENLPSRRSQRKREPSASALWLRRITYFASGLFVLALVWLLLSALLTVHYLGEARLAAQSIQSSISEQNIDELMQSADDFSVSAGQAEVFSRDVIWQTVEKLPWIGPQALALTTIASSAHILGSEGLPNILKLEVLMEPGALVPQAGTLELEPMVKAQPFAERATRAFIHAERQVAAVDPDLLIPPVREQVEQAHDLLHHSSSIVSTLNGVIQLAPTMLGIEATRSYVVMFQNSAELRATGGIPGALALVTADAGHLSLVEQASTSDFSRFDPPVVQLPQGTQNVFGTLPAQRIQDVNYTPDFALSGEITQAMWAQQFGQRVDGVVSVDPVALTYLLDATGPIILPSGDELNTDNALQLLLSDVYARYSNPADQDEFFAAAAAAVFERIANGQFNNEAFLKALSRAGAEHRIYLWNSDPAEQALIAGTTLATLLPQHSESASGFGFYFNDQTGAKMDKYFDAEVTVSSDSSRNDLRPVITSEITLTNTAPADVATTLPEYVTGGGWFGTEPGTIRTQVLAYGPGGSAWSDALLNGENLNIFTTADGDYAVALFEVYLIPGQTAVMSLKNIGLPGAPATVNVVQTPLSSHNVN